MGSGRPESATAPSRLKSTSTSCGRTSTNRSAKSAAQIGVVLQGIPYVTDGGSFTLTTGIVGREVIRTGAASAAANGAIERFVASAAAELPRGLRINAVSPNVLAEAPGYHPFFPGFIPVPAATVAEAYVRFVEGIGTGRVFEVD